MFSIQHERNVNQDNTVVLDNRVFQIGKTRWRNTLAGCTVTVHEMLDGAVVIRYGPHTVARFEPCALPEKTAKRTRSAQPMGRKREVA